MRKLFFFLCFAFFGNYSEAQARLGCKNTDIFVEFWNLSPQYKRNQKGTLYLIVKNKGYTTYHFFDKKNISYRAIIYPDNIKEQAKLAGEYDTNYLKKGSNIWMVYAKDITARVSEITHKGHTFFVWDMSK